MKSLPRHIYLFISLLSIICPSLSFGQAYIRTIPNISQLPVVSVHRLMLDSEGYMWYGTVDGLCRDDGYDILVFRNDYLHHQPMQSNVVVSIAEDSLGHILFGTTAGAYFIDKRDYHVRPFPHQELQGAIVNNIFITSDNKAIISTNNKGTYLLSYSQSPSDPDGLLTKTTDKELTTFVETTSHDLVGCFYDEPLHILDPKTHEWRLLDTSSIKFKSFNIRKDGDYLWLATIDRGIYRISLKEKDINNRYRQFDEGPELSSNNFLYLQPDSKNNLLWATSNSDIHAFKTDNNGLVPIDLTQYLAGYTRQQKMTNELTIDHDGNIWISGYDRSSFVIEPEPLDIKCHRVKEINDRFSRSTVIITLCGDESDGVYWLSQEREGVNLYRPSTGTLVNFRDFSSTSALPINVVHEMIKSRDPHCVWVLNGGNELYKLMSTDMQMSLVSSATLPPGVHTKTLFEDRDGLLWVGTYNGIYCYNPVTDAVSTISDSIGHTTSFTQTSDGKIWATVTEVGICEIRSGQIFKVHNLSTDLLCICSTLKDEIWIGTGDGELLELDLGNNDMKINNHSQNAGLSGDMIEKIVCDQYNHLWILTNQLLTVYAPTTGAVSVINTLKSSDSSIPLLTRFMPRAISYNQLSQSILIGGFNGFLIAHASENLNKASRPSHVKFTSYNISREKFPIDIGNSISLSADEQNIEVFFSTLDLLHSSSIQYSYNIDDNGWTHLASGVNSIRFNQLSRGSHTVHVKSTDLNGIWSEDYSTLTIYRAPHWYESDIAYIIYALLSIIALYGLVRYFMNKSRKKEAEMWHDSAELVAMRKYVTDSHPAQKSSSNISPSIDYVEIDRILLDKVKSCISEHIGDSDFNVISLAECMNMSRSTLNRKIKAITDKTPLQLIRDTKMDYARQMLSNQTATVGDVAQRVGYSDRDYFAQTFQEYYGMLPGEYMKQQKQQ